MTKTLLVSSHVRRYPVKPKPSQAYVDKHRELRIEVALMELERDIMAIDFDAMDWKATP